MGGLLTSKEPSSQDDDVSDDAPAQDTPETDTTSDAKMTADVDDDENPF
jgi:hypothetical protein